MWRSEKGLSESSGGLPDQCNARNPPLAMAGVIIACITWMLCWLEGKSLAQIHFADLAVVQHVLGGA